LRRLPKTKPEKLKNNRIFAKEYNRISFMETITIANPLYDAAFKYLMQDKASAISLLSAIMETEIVELDFHPQEYVAEIPEARDDDGRKLFDALTLFRMDFTAKIKTASGFKKVLIEIQKSKFFSNVMRFREYIGNQYRSAENSVKTRLKNGELSIEPIPIICIFILGEGLPGFDDYSVIHAGAYLEDAITKERIPTKSKYFEYLHHESYTINVPVLHKHKRNDLEKLLQIFGDNTSYHFAVNINDESIPVQFRHILTRLIKAFANDDVRKRMEEEERALETFTNLERERNRFYAETLVLAKEKAEAEKRFEQESLLKAEAEKRAEQESLLKEEAEKRAEQESLLKAEAEKKSQSLTERLHAAVRKFSLLGESAKNIAESLNISEAEVRDILGKS
jgi:Skp family chaperone for outer membrane proteins